MRDILWLWRRYKLVAIPATFICAVGLHKALACCATKADKKADRIWWIPLLVGVFERAIIGLLIGWQVPGAVGFIGA